MFTLVCPYLVAVNDPLSQPTNYPTLSRVQGKIWRQTSFKTSPVYEGIIRALYRIVPVIHCVEISRRAYVPLL